MLQKIVTILDYNTALAENDKKQLENNYQSLQRQKSQAFESFRFWEGSLISLPDPLRLLGKHSFLL